MLEMSRDDLDNPAITGYHFRLESEMAGVAYTAVVKGEDASPDSSDYPDNMLTAARD